MNNGGLVARMIENGKVTSIQNLPITKPNVSLWDKTLEVLKNGGKWVAENGWEFISNGIVTAINFLAENNQVFIIIGIVGMIIVITGKEDLGKKLTSGSFLTYIIFRGVAAIC